jgi:hypothetical protein
MQSLTQRCFERKRQNNFTSDHAFHTCRTSPYQLHNLERVRQVIAEILPEGNDKHKKVRQA